MESYKVLRIWDTSTALRQDVQGNKYTRGERKQHLNSKHLNPAAAVAIVHANLLLLL